ncbi:HD-GYP domain-containing protein [Phycisphaera mikurensis]|uniref:HD-GYP domain-containing protein n=1 Tax=Phycisphaera mikurensis (strain NBRC 102666 / KCTC 22515 / FYK2301M01) TaxID=1142394 RepID=I0IF89_PHYMF|nr:HD-GYP domain-containing protein [Phycisphaera mikurensis]MBB6440677.1 HD-GYP domain-containing protein (c-di-GMP phosphodiesterase class II) [Phycisphaera mikurensis]BAM03927.1 hypothetical protein PSMK_17680 [Phycisphaera mikurensis NBRC 102666]
MDHPTPASTTNDRPLQAGPTPPGGAGAPDAASAPAPTIRLADLVSALSAALDVTEGQPQGHSARTCLIAMQIASELHLSVEEHSALFYASQLKDLGCSSNAARIANLFGGDDRGIKRDFKTVDWARLGESIKYTTRHAFGSGTMIEKIGRAARIGAAGPAAGREMISIRCERGAAISRLFGVPEATSEAIYALDEHWDGRGHPHGTRREAIPLLARVLGLAQTLEVFVAAHGVGAGMDMLRRRRGHWFDPTIADVALRLENQTNFWSGVYTADPFAALVDLEPPEKRLLADDARIDDIAIGFAQVVDAKSPWTRRHSEGVEELAVGIARHQGLPAAEVRQVRRAALLHDVGKLGVSNTILDKPGKLDDAEFREMRQHAAFTHQILGRVRGLGDLSEVAAGHHEKLDGTGYHRGLVGDAIHPHSRILAVADMYEAMTAERPYRATMPREKVLSILEAEARTAVCGGAVEGLRGHLDRHGFEPSTWSAEPEPAAAPRPRIAA